VTVYLVGAGPGDGGLLTVRGAELLAAADAVVHDRLVDDRLLALVPAGADLHDVGKRPGGKVRQGDINELLVKLGRMYPSGTVVRLKGGDPFVFGRGGEEALALEAAGLAYEVVPGVSAVNGVLAAAGIPLTHRGLSPAFTVVTGHGADGTASGGPRPVDWDALARLGGTVVVLMGVAHREEIASRLMRGGLAGSTPAAVVENGTWPDQRVLRTTLERLGETEVESPATVVIGEVAALELASLAARPLHGWKVAVTRTRQQASVLAVALRRAGAIPVEVPTIAIADPDDGGAALRSALSDLRSGAYEWVVFTSENTVERVFTELHDARALGGVRVAAIGDGTAGRLAAHGVVADLVPPSFVAEALAEAFPAAPAGAAAPPDATARRVLLPRAAVARDVLERALSAKGWAVDVVTAYRTVRPELSPALVERVSGLDAVTFTASSTVTGWVELVGLDRLPPVVACIGPITAEAARRAGMTVTLEASPHSIDGLVAALVDYAAQHGRP